VIHQIVEVLVNELIKRKKKYLKKENEFCEKNVKLIFLTLRKKILIFKNSKF
jgi:hypothetical protein